MYVLFGGVGQLVFPPAVVGFLDARVCPEHLYCTDVRLVERRHLLHVHLAHQQSIGLETAGGVGEGGGWKGRQQENSSKCDV